MSFKLKLKHFNWVLFLLIFFHSLFISSQEIERRLNLSPYYFSETLFFDPQDKRRLGIEIEFENLSPYETAKIIKSRFGGKIKKTKTTINIGIIKVLDNGQVLYQTKEITDYIVLGTPIGDVKVVHEFNEDGNIVDLKNTRPATEVITPIINVNALDTFQKMVDLLRENGATGTTADSALGIHVTTEINNGVITNETGAFLADLLRNLVRENHWLENQYDLNIPEKRRVYMEPYSKGFKALLMNPNYLPTTNQLYDDFIYRQTLELMEIEKSDEAWTLPIQEVKKIVLSQNKKLIPMVAKFQPLKITSLLIYFRPDDYMSQLYSNIEDWITPGPVVESRESNNDFQVAIAAKRMLGFLAITEKFGSINFDHFVSDTTGVDLDSLQHIRENLKRDPEAAIIFRYFTKEDLANNLNLARIFSYYNEEGVIVGTLFKDNNNLLPLVIPGESVVFHRSFQQRQSITGKYNPTLINSNIAQMLSLDYVQYKFWEEYAPGSMPETYLLAHLFKTYNGLEKTIIFLNSRFPKGWVLKDVQKPNSSFAINSNSVDILKEIKSYMESNFDKHLETISNKFDFKSKEFEIALENHPNYLGWKANQMLTKPYTTIIKKQLKVKKYIQVEIIAGKVLGHGSSQVYNDSQQADRVNSYDIKRAEAFARNLLAQLPKNLQNLTLSMQIGILENGGIKLLNSQMGGNSNYLATNKTAIHALNDFLRRYPQLVNSHQIDLGMTEGEQIKYLKEKLNKWGMSNINISNQSAASPNSRTFPYYPRNRFSKKKSYLLMKQSCYEILSF